MNNRGGTSAAEVLGVNYRTLVMCQQSRRVSRRMRQALQEFRGAQEAGDARPGIVGGDGVGESRQDRAAALEQENRALRETVQAQAGELEALNRRLAELGSRDGFWVWTVRLTAIKTARGFASAPAEAQFAQCRGGYVGGVFR